MGPKIDSIEHKKKNTTTIKYNLYFHIYKQVNIMQLSC